jgi:hypothetical protein
MAHSAEPELVPWPIDSVLAALSPQHRFSTCAMAQSADSVLALLPTAKIEYLRHGQQHIKPVSQS